MADGTNPAFMTRVHHIRYPGLTVVCFPTPLLGRPLLLRLGGLRVVPLGSPDLLELLLFEFACGVAELPPSPLCCASATLSGVSRVPLMSELFLPSPFLPAFSSSSFRSSRRRQSSGWRSIRGRRCIRSSRQVERTPPCRVRPPRPSML